MKTNMGLPEIDFVLYLWKKLIFLKFFYNEIPIFSNLGPIKNKRANIEVKEVNPSLLQLKSIANYIKCKIREKVGHK